MNGCISELRNYISIKTKLDTFRKCLDKAENHMSFSEDQMQQKRQDIVCEICTEKKMFHKAVIFKLRRKGKCSFSYLR